MQFTKWAEDDTRTWHSPLHKSNSQFRSKNFRALLLLKSDAFVVGVLRPGTGQYIIIRTHFLIMIDHQDYVVDRLNPFQPIPLWRNSNTNYSLHWKINFFRPSQ